MYISLNAEPIIGNIAECVCNLDKTSISSTMIALKKRNLNYFGIPSEPFERISTIAKGIVPVVLRARSTFG